MEQFNSKIFYEFESNMFYLLQHSSRDMQEILNELYKIIKSSQAEIFSIINASLKINKNIKKMINDELVTSRSQIKEILEDDSFDKEDDFHTYQISQMVSLREDRFRRLEMVVEIQSISSIVLLLSLLESTLFEMIKKLSNLDDEKFPNIKTVFKRDRGIIKYLKYLDKYLSEKENNFIVGKPKYNELLHWINLRNNIVHNFNRFNNKLYLESLSKQIQISYRKLDNKFCFNTKSVVQLGKLVALILNICIVEGMSQFFNVEILELDGYYPPIIFD